MRCIRCARGQRVPATDTPSYSYLAATVRFSLRLINRSQDQDTISDRFSGPVPGGRASTPLIRRCDTSSLGTRVIAGQKSPLQNKLKGWILRAASTDLKVQDHDPSARACETRWAPLIAPRNSQLHFPPNRVTDHRIGYTCRALADSRRPYCAVNRGAKHGE